jgi:putative endonuclease
MPKVFTSKTQKIGELGEKTVVQYLKNKGYSIIEANFTCPFGEIDIIAFSRGTHYFIEVKSASQDKIDQHGWKPEQNFHSMKLEKMLKTVRFYTHKRREVQNIELKLAIVVFDDTNKKAHVSLETIQ